MKTKHRRRNRALDLFREHPLVEIIFRLKGSRSTFTMFAERIEAGEKSVLEGYGSDWFRAAAADVDRQIVELLSLIRIDGEPLIIDSIL
jgi:hypothetical protein